MAVFADRPVGYKLGLLGLPLAAVLFIVGYSVPYWVTANVADQNLGLWTACYEPRGCYSLGVSGLAIYFHFVRISETVGLIMFLLATVFGFSSNFRNVAMSYSRRVESTTAMAGVWGLVGAIVFFAKYEQATSSYYLVRVSTQYGFGIFLTTAASAGALLCCLLIGCNNPNPTITGGGQAVAMGGVVVHSAYPPPSSSPYAPSPSSAVGGNGVYQVPSPSAPLPPQQQDPPQYPGYSSGSYPSTTSTAYPTK